MNLATTLVYAYGTSEGVRKEWDTRGRSSHVEENFDPRGGIKKFYHGTVLDSAKAILKEGLHQDPKQIFWIQQPRESIFDSGEAKASPNGYVFMTEDKKLAESYAEFRDKFAKAPVGELVRMRRNTSSPEDTGSLTLVKPREAASMKAGTPAIVELSLPFEEYSKLEPDTGGDPRGWREKGIIPKEYISGVSVLQGGKWKKATEDMLAAAAKKVYLVYYGDLDALKEHLNMGK